MPQNLENGKGSSARPRGGDGRKGGVRGSDHDNRPDSHMNGSSALLENGRNGNGNSNVHMAGNWRDGKFRAMVLYPYPPELDGISLQGEYLYRGLKEHGYSVAPCNRMPGFEKEFLYKSFNPQVAIGIGFWGDIPNIILGPQAAGIIPVPWLNADGWVANYHDVLESLQLIFVTSNWVKETYRRDGVSDRNIYPVPIGIDTRQMRPIPKSDARVARMREMLGVKPGEKMILTIGGDITSKGFQEVLKALGKIGNSFKDWKYVGKAWENRQPTYHYKAEAGIIREFGFRKKVKYIDGPISRDSLRVLMSAADIYAAPSRIEGFGMVQVEAQACGIPVLSIDAMGVKDTVVHNETGLLAKVGETVELEQEWVYKDMGFPRRQMIKFDRPKTFGYRADIDDLAQHLLRLLQDDELRKKMGGKGRERAEQNFDYRITSLKMAKMIEEKLNL